MTTDTTETGRTQCKAATINQLACPSYSLYVQLLWYPMNKYVLMLHVIASFHSFITNISPQMRECNGHLSNNCFKRIGTNITPGGGILHSSDSARGCLPGRGGIYPTGECAVVMLWSPLMILYPASRPGSNPEWGLIYYEASITAQGLPKPSSLRGSTLGTRAAEHRGCNWGMQID